MITKLSPLRKNELNTTYFPYQISTEISLLHAKLNVPDLVDRMIRVNKRIQARSAVPFAFWGGMSLYAYLLDIDFYDFNLVKERTQNGKNDFDIGVSITDISRIMDDFNWREEKSNQAGRVRPGWEIIDVMVREKLPSFPSRQVEIKGTVLTLAAPEEMLFQKMQAMATNDESWPDKPGEVKWALDIRLLKTYLAKTLKLSRLKLEEYLRKNWSTYIKEKSNMSRQKQYEVIDNITTKIKKGLSPKSGIDEYFKIRFGEAEHETQEQLIMVFGQNEAINIQALVNSKTAQEFEKIFKKIIRDSYKSTTYEDVLAKAETAYANLLPKRLLPKYPNLSKLGVQMDEV
jgi:hypothetical protein